MAQGKNTTDFSGLLFQFMGAQDPMLSMHEWLCSQMMEAEVSNQLEQRNISKAQSVPATDAGFAQGDWIPEWARCICWYPR